MSPALGDASDADIAAHHIAAMEAGGKLSPDQAKNARDLLQIVRTHLEADQAYRDDRDSRMARALAQVWGSVGPEAFRYGNSSAVDPHEIARDFSKHNDPIRAEVGPGYIEFSGKNGSLLVQNPESDTPKIYSPDANSEGKEEGGGSHLYQAAFTWAHNNGKVIHPSDNLTWKNAYVRRTANMFSSALRHLTTRHILPGEAQGVTWRTGDDSFNIGQLAKREAAQVYRKLPELYNLTYDFTDHTVRDASGQAVPPNQLKEYLLARPEASIDSGIGLTTAQRAIITRTALQERGFNDGAAPEGLGRDGGRGTRTDTEHHAPGGGQLPGSRAARSPGLGPVEKILYGQAQEGAESDDVGGSHGAGPEAADSHPVDSHSAALREALASRLADFPREIFQARMQGIPPESIAARHGLTPSDAARLSDNIANHVAGLMTRQGVDPEAARKAVIGKPPGNLFDPGSASASANGQSANSTSRVGDAIHSDLDDPRSQSQERGRNIPGLEGGPGESIQSRRPDSESFGGRAPSLEVMPRPTSREATVKVRPTEDDGEGRAASARGADRLAPGDSGGVPEKQIVDQEPRQQTPDLSSRSALIAAPVKAARDAVAANLANFPRAIFEARMRGASPDEIAARHGYDREAAAKLSDQIANHVAALLEAGASIRSLPATLSPQRQIRMRTSPSRKRRSARE